MARSKIKCVRPWRRIALSGVAAVLLAGSIAGCGTRVDDAEIIAAGNGSGTRSATGGGQVSSGVEPGTTDVSPAPSDEPIVGAEPSGDPSSPSVAADGAPTPAASAGGPAARTCTRPGAPVVVGQVGGWSGFVGTNVIGAKTGLAAWARDVNARGGVACHPVQLVSVDDASDASRALSAVQDLAKNKKAVVLLANINPISIAGFRAGVNQTGVPSIGSEQSTFDYNSDPLLFPIGGNGPPVYYGPMIELAKQGKTKVGIIWCVEATPCSTAHTAYQDKIDVAKSTLVYDAQISLTQTDFTSQCQAAKNAGVQQLGVIADGGAIQRVARSCASVGLVVPFVGFSLATAFDESDPNIRGATVWYANNQVPWFLDELPAQKEFLAVMNRYAPGQKVTGSTMLGYAAGKMFEVAIEKLGDEALAPITTAMVLKGLGQVKDETLGGLTSPTTYTAGKPTPQSNCVSIVYFDKDGKFKAPNGNRFQCV